MWLPILAEEPNGRHLPGDILEVYWGSAAFIVLVALLAWKAGPAISGALRGRTERIQAELDLARAERQAAEEALAAKDADTPDLDSERARILAEAEETAVKLQEDMVAKASAEADQVRVRGRQEIENQKKQALAEIKDEFARMTRGAAEAIVVEELNDAAQADLIDNYINQVDQLA